jgi:hypothetical protein
MKTDITFYIDTAESTLEDIQKSKEMPVPMMETSSIGVPEWEECQG